MRSRGSGGRTVHLECIDPDTPVLDENRMLSFAYQIETSYSEFFKMCYSLDAEVDLPKMCSLYCMQFEEYRSADPSLREECCRKAVAELKKDLKDEFKIKEKSRKFIIKLFANPKFWNDLKQALKNGSREDIALTVRQYGNLSLDFRVSEVLEETISFYWEEINRLEGRGYSEEQWHDAVPKYLYCALRDPDSGIRSKYFMPYEGLIKANSEMIVQKLREVL